MGIVKIADGAFFVPAYSTQTIIPAYDENSTLQSAGGAVLVSEVTPPEWNAEETIHQK